VGEEIPEVRRTFVGNACVHETATAGDRAGIENERRPDSCPPYLTDKAAMAGWGRDFLYPGYLPEFQCEWEFCTREVLLPQCSETVAEINVHTK
jgi:hypothetical protein